MQIDAIDAFDLLQLPFELLRRLGLANFTRHGEAHMSFCAVTDNNLFGYGHQGLFH